MGLTDNIRDFFRQQGDQQTKGYGNFPNNQVVFPFNSDIGFFSGVDQVSRRETLRFLLSECFRY